MTCLEFQGMMIRYINGELLYKEKEEFMEHLSSCPDCKDELEIYYIILTSMDQMDRDVPLTDDFHEAFLKRLSATERDLIMRHRARIRRRIAFPTVVGAAMILNGISFRVETEDEPISASVESQYEMKFRFAEEERHRVFRQNVTEETLLSLMEKLP